MVQLRLLIIRLSYRGALVTLKAGTLDQKLRAKVCEETKLFVVELRM